jgi:nuclear transcription factor Y gamma
MRAFLLQVTFFYWCYQTMETDSAAAAVSSSAHVLTGKRAFETRLIPGPEEYSAAVVFLGEPERSEESTAVPPDLDKALRSFWEEEKGRAAALHSAPSSEASEVFKYANDLPLARIKRIMKSDEDVRMISAEAPVLFAKACELFISDLSMRAWCYTTEDKGKRRTLTREDVCTAVQQTDIFDFLVEVLLPRECQESGGAK